MDQIDGRRSECRQLRTQQTADEQVNKPPVKGVEEKIREAEARRPHVPDGVLERKRKNRQRTIDAGVIEISPVRLEEEMERLDVADPLVRRDDENVIEDERIRNRVRIADRHQGQTQD